MLRNLLGLIILGAVALGALAGVAFYLAPRDFRANMALLQPNDGPTAYLILQLDAAALRQAQLERAADEMAAALRAADPPIRFSGRGVVDDTARVRLVDPAQMSQAHRALAEVAHVSGGATDTLAYVEHEDGLIEARLPFSVARDNTRLAMAQSIQIIQRRVNPTGEHAVTVDAVGEDRIVVEARGETDSSRLRSLIGPTGMLTFNMVREASAEDVAAGLLPIGTMLAQPYAQGGAAELVERRPAFTGEHIVRANPSVDPVTHAVALSFELDDAGARMLCRITTTHVGERFAVLLDNQVVAAPRINDPICGGSGQIAGNFTAESANRLAALLRSGALPAPLVFVEEGLRPAPTAQTGD